MVKYKVGDIILEEFRDIILKVKDVGVLNYKFEILTKINIHGKIYIDYIDDVDSCKEFRKLKGKLKILKVLYG